MPLDKYTSEIWYPYKQVLFFSFFQPVTSNDAIILPLNKYNLRTFKHKIKKKKKRIPLKISKNHTLLHKFCMKDNLKISKKSYPFRQILYEFNTIFRLYT